MLKTRNPAGIERKNITMSKKWTTKEVVITAMLGAVVGVIFTLLDFAYMPLSAALGAVFMEITFGIYMLGGALPMFVVRKPGAGIFGALVAALMNLLLGSPYGIQLIIANACVGIGVELGFALVQKYKGVLMNFVVAGIVAAILQFIRDFIVFYGGSWQGFMAPLLIVRILSGIFVTYVLVKLIAAALVKTGVLKGLACAEEK